MLKLYQTVHRQDRNLTKQKRAVNITVLASRLASGKFHLLTGGNDDQLVRILCLPEKGPPAIKHLHVTLNQILAKLKEAASFEWESDESSEEEGSVWESEDASDENVYGHSPQTACD